MSYEQLRGRTSIKFKFKNPSKSFITEVNIAGNEMFKLKSAEETSWKNDIKILALVPRPAVRKRILLALRTRFSLTEHQVIHRRITLLRLLATMCAKASSEPPALRVRTTVRRTKDARTTRVMTARTAHNTMKPGEWSEAPLHFRQAADISE